MAEETEVLLAEVSIYLRIEFAESEYERLGHLTDETAREAATRYFSVPVRIEVDLGEGSVFGKVKVSGLLFGLAILGDIDGSIELAKKTYEGAQAFAEMVSEHFISDAGASHEQVESVQVRANAPKQLVRVLERIQKLENSTGNLSPKDMQVELHKLRKQLERALPRVPKQEKLQLLNELKFKNLPPFSKWPMRPPDEPLRTGRGTEFDVGDWSRASGTATTPPRERFGAGGGAPKIRYRNTFFVEPTRTRG